MHVTGNCFCGFVAFEADVIDRAVFVCHCTSCQKNSGSAFRVNVVVDGDSFRLLSGELDPHKHLSDSGRVRNRPFCPKCGSQISSGPPPGETAFMTLRVGCLDQRDSLTPTAQIWARSAQPWAILPHLPTFQTQPTEEEARALVAGG